MRYHFTRSKCICRKISAEVLSHNNCLLILLIIVLTNLIINISSAAFTPSSAQALARYQRQKQVLAYTFIRKRCYYYQKASLFSWQSSLTKQLSDTDNNCHMSNKKHKVGIHWFRNGLRFHDNPALKKACDECETVVPLYVINPDEPFVQSPGIRPGCIRVNFVLESIKEIDQKLRQMPTSTDDNENNSNNRSRMIVLLGKHEDVIPKVVTAVNASALYYEQDPAAPIRAHDQKVLAALNAVKSKDFCTHGSPTHSLNPMEVYLSQCKGNVAPSSYGSFTKIFQKIKIAKEVEDVKVIPPLPVDALQNIKQVFKDYNHANVQFDVPSLEELGYDQTGILNRTKGGINFDGGEDSALSLLQFMMNRKEWVASFEKPNTSPNALTVDTTGLSPYVKHGCLSPRRFYNELAKVYAKFNPKNLSKPPVSLHGQLMWREYNYLMGYSTPNFDKMINNPIARQVPWDDDPELLSAWKNSRTGYPFIDAIMTQLRETGWIHHLARHAVACFLTRGDLWQSWEKGAAVFEEHLIDADWSINNFNWQWLSCTAHFYQYFRCYSPVSFGKKTDPNGDYIRKWLPIFKNMPAKYIYEPWEAPLELQRKVGIIIGETYPYPIVDHKVISKSNMGRMQEAYDAQKNGNPMPNPPLIRTDATLPSQDQGPPKKKRKP